MASLRSTLASFGTAGAAANARAVLDARRREDWLVAGLARRVDHQVAAAALARRTSSAVTATRRTA